MSAHAEPSPAGPWDLNEQPAWAEEFDILMASTPQFVISGNVYDRYLLRGEQRCIRFERLGDVLTRLLLARGYSFVVFWDPVNGARVVLSAGAEDSQLDSVRSLVGVREIGRQFDDVAASIEELQALLPRIVNCTERCALIVSNASRLDVTKASNEIPDDVGTMLRVAQTLARDAIPDSDSPFNLVIWITDSERDLPAWFTAQGAGVRLLDVPLPDKPSRTYAAYRYYLNFADEESGDDAMRKRAALLLGDLTHGMRLRALDEIWRLARWQGLKMDDIEQAVRAFRVGVVRNPWSDGNLARAISGAQAAISDDSTPFDSKVFGQSEAVRHTVNILMRSALGLSSAQAQGPQTAPRGVLFFAGPTGVGKTQLAKAINRLVFDADDPIRFDMSEFSFEHTAARLIGSPPGYVGHGAGGELTNAIRQRPFSVVLFDEIEKAHPSIMDKFLQILSDGRLTDGAGQTVYFTESIIVFTSNWGMHEPDGSKTNANGTAVLRPVERGDSYQDFSQRVVRNIEDGFRQLARPEILNRIGHDNIVVFDFIQRKEARKIFESNVANVLRRFRQSSGVALTVGDRALDDVWEFAWRRCDTERMGGRGIGSAVETALTNPLALAMFDPRFAGSGSLKLTSMHQDDAGHWQPTLERS